MDHGRIATGRWSSLFFAGLFPLLLQLHVIEMPVGAAGMTANTIFYYNVPRGPCAVCGAEGSACARCRLDFYCGKEHQREDAARHRPGCGAVALREAAEDAEGVLGRYVVVALRDVPKGTVVMRELPLLTFDGPLGAKKGELKCVSCYRPFKGHQLNSVSGWRQCSGCGLPVCGAQCSLSELHQPECAEFQRAKVRVRKELVQKMDGRTRAALMTLRMTLALERDIRLRDLPYCLPALPASPFKPPGGADSVFYTWKEAEALSDYRQLQCSHRDFEAETCRVVDWLHEVAGLRHIPRERLARGFGAALLNAVGCAPGMHVCAALYGGLSLLEQSCSPNVLHAPMPDGRPGEVAVLTSRAVRRGERLALDRVPHLTTRSREHRREALAWRGFVCRCARCLDPTERGLFLGSWCCRPCAGEGRLSLTMRRPGESLAWECYGCSRLYRDSMPELAAAGRELQRLLRRGADADQRQWEAFMARHRFPAGPLHASHFLLLWAKEEIVRRRPFAAPQQPLCERELQSLDRRAAYCKDLLCVIDKLDGALDTYLEIAIALFALVMMRMPDESFPREPESDKRESTMLKELTWVMQLLDDPVAAMALRESVQTAKEAYDSLVPRLHQLGLKPHEFRYL